MKKRNLLLGLLAALLAMGLVFVGCGDDGSGDPTSPGGQNPGDGNTGGTNLFIGTWDGTDVDGDPVTLVVTASTWTVYEYSGTYTYSGNTASLKDNMGSIIGTATLSGSTLTVTGSNIPYAPYTLTKTGGNEGGGKTLNAPSGVTATAQSSSSISVSWNPVSGATSYKVYFEIGTSTTKNLADTANGTSYTHTGLTASTTYYYYIVAVNSAGESGYSSSASATTQSSGDGGETTPNTPTGVTATAQSSSSILISWSSVTGATGYYIYRSSSASGSYSQVGTSNTTSYTNTGLTASTTYYYKVAAYNSAGTGSQSSYDYATTQSSGGGTTTPNAPTGVTATAQSPTSIRISWNAVSGATSYKVYYGIASYSTFTQLIGTPTATNYVDNDCEPGETAYYKVSAVNSSGESSLSSYVYATTLSILGRWYTTQSAANSGTGTPTYEFLANGNLNSSGIYIGTFTDNYSASGATGNTVAIKSGGSTLGTATFSLSGTSMTITNAGSSGLLTGTYYKRAN